MQKPPFRSRRLGTLAALAGVSFAVASATNAPYRPMMGGGDHSMMGAGGTRSAWYREGTGPVSSIAEARALLGDDAFAVAWAAGRAMPLATAVAEAQTVQEHAATRAVGTPDPRRAHGLTRRELDVLRLLAEGRSNPEIAAALYTSRATVETHVHHILAKFGVKTRAAAADRARRRGLI